MSLNLNKQFVEKETDGYLLLAKHVIAADNQAKNLLLSPLSIHVVLSMIAAGSSGSTRAQLLTYLKSDNVEHLNSFYSQIAATIFVDGSPHGGPLLSTKNGLWVDQSLTLKPAYRDIVQNSYKAVAEHADFRNQAEKARQEVNSWCEKETKGLIKEILPADSVTKTTRLILANAVYFKGTWDEEFDPELTTDGDFYLLNGSPIRVPFMTSRKRKCVCAFDGFKVAKLPYKQGDDKRRFSMYIYLPDAKDGLRSLMERICSEPGFIDRHLPYEAVILDAFRIPKFKIGFDFDACTVMEELGVVYLFEMGGLTEMVEESAVGELLKVNRILHKAFVEVIEMGTEAAAVTVADEDMGCGLMIEEEKKPRLRFVADHPFLFTIREDTSGVVLFVGQLLDPLADASFGMEAQK